MSTKLRVALLACGSFNPITNAHLRMFETARDWIAHNKGMEVVAGIISPVNDSYKKAGLLTAEHRLAMAEAAVEGSDWIRVDRWESQQSEYITTVNALRHFDAEINKDITNPSDRIVIKLLCGGDLLDGLDNPSVWATDDVHEILGKHGLVCIERTGNDSQKTVYESDLLHQYSHNIYLVREVCTNDISSTRIRQHLRRGYSVKYFVADKTIDYIYEHKLYNSRKPGSSSK